MHNIVVDASVVLAWFEEGNQAELALTIHDDILKGNVSACAPGFLLLETANICYRRKKLSQLEIEAILRNISSIWINYNDTPLTVEMEHIVSLVIQHRISAYDAQYLHLAQKLNCKLVSFDKELLRIKDWVIAPGKLVSK